MQILLTAFAVSIKPILLRSRSKGFPQSLRCCKCANISPDGALSLRIVLFIGVIACGGCRLPLLTVDVSVGERRLVAILSLDYVEFNFALS